jgi:hypothetical protein
MKRFFSLAGWVLLAIIILSGSLYATGFPGPFQVFDTRGRSVFQVDLNGRLVTTATSPTSGEGVQSGYITCTTAQTYPVLFKNSQGTAVAMPDTNYAIFVQAETGVGATAHAVPTATATRTTAGFSILCGSAPTSDVVLRWTALRR